MLAAGDGLDSLRLVRVERFDAARLDWYDLRNMLLVAETVVRAGLARRESRGAHQREDFPNLDARWTVNQAVRLESDGLAIDAVPVPHDPARDAAQ